MNPPGGHQPETEIEPSATDNHPGHLALGDNSHSPVIKYLTPEDDKSQNNNNEVTGSPVTSPQDDNVSDAIGGELPPKGFNHLGVPSEVESSAPSDYGDHGDLEDFSDLALPMPPDGGWGWAVCFGAFFVMLILDGMLFSFGVFFLDLLDYFGESKGLTAWVGSTLMGTHLIVGPFTSTLVNLWGVRKTAIVGVFVAAFGFIISVYVPSIPVLIFTYGVIGGIGVSMIYIPALLIVGFYFEKKRALANGIANSGSGFGAFLYAPLCRFLQDEYSWRGALLILSGILLNCLVCAAMFRPVEYKNLDRTPEESTTGIGDEEKQLISEKMFDKKILDLKMSKSQSQSNVANRSPALERELWNKRKCSAPFTDRITSSGQHLDIPLHMKTSHTFHSTGHILHRSGLIYRSVGSSLSGTPVHLSSEIIQKPMYRKDIFYSGSVMKLPEMSGLAADPDHFPGSVLRIPDAPSTDSEGSSQMLECREITYILQQLMGTALFKNPVFILCVVMSVLWTTHASVLSILPDYAVQRGVGKAQAGLLLSVIGISNIVGRLVAGYLADRPQLDVIVINAGALLVGGITCFAIPATDKYPLLVAEAAVFGLCMATWTSLRPIVLVDLLGLEYLTNAFGLLAMFQGVAFCIGSPVAGWLFDYTQSYQVPFLCAGAAFVMSSLTCIPMKRISTWQKRHGSVPEISNITI